MLRIKELALSLDHTDNDLRRLVAATLGIAQDALCKITIVRRSIDARARGSVMLIYTVDVLLSENVVVDRSVFNNKSVTPAPEKAYHFSVTAPHTQTTPPIVVGAGPCGLFAALLLARLGRRPVVIERGKPVRERMREVRAFWREGVLNPESNALFGEGGAGAFSDGKLATQIRDKEQRRDWIIRELIQAGAPEEIRFSSKPHIGTNNLIIVIQGIRATILELGGSIQYESRVTNLLLDQGRIRGVVVNDKEEICADQVLLATGHSARDTFDMLYENGVVMSPKAFSIGARIEHPQQLIDTSQYGKHAGHPRLGAAEYKAVWHCRNGRSVYTFCMCPGGHVIAACNEPETVTTNGMSHFARKAPNANSGLLVGVTPDDYGNTHPLAGVAFQRQWEKAAYVLGGGGYQAPVQLVGDLLAGRPSTGLGQVQPSYTPGVTPADLRNCLPQYVIDAWREAIPAIARRIRHFDLPDAVLTGVETRSSSPIRIERDATGQSISVRGLYPAGEGAGHAGGIMSAAMDGMRAAEQIATNIATSS